MQAIIAIKTGKYRTLDLSQYIPKVVFTQLEARARNEIFVCKKRSDAIHASMLSLCTPR